MSASQLNLKNKFKITQAGIRTWRERSANIISNKRAALAALLEV